jgi:hypothetical protein
MGGAEGMEADTANAFWGETGAQCLADRTGKKAVLIQQFCSPN